MTAADHTETVTLEEIERVTVTLETDPEEVDTVALQSFIATSNTKTIQAYVGYPVTYVVAKAGYNTVSGTTDYNITEATTISVTLTQSGGDTDSDSDTDTDTDTDTEE